MKPVKFSDMIRPICLYSPDLEEVENPETGLVVAGWGRTERERSSSLLQYTFLDSVSMGECQAVYGAAGEAGGPIMARVGNTWYLAGLVSFGTQQCDSSLPGIYTRISYFYSWIEGVMRN